MKKLLLAPQVLIGCIVALSLTVAISVLAFAPPVSAAEPESSCGDAATSIITCEAAKSNTEEAKDSANNPVIAILTFVMQILTGAVGIAAIGALIYAGILYSAAGGESAQVQKAKTLIKDTVIGLVCYGFMIVILNFFIPGGVFGQQSTVGGGTTSVGGGDGGGSGGSNPTPIGGACYWKQFSKPPGGELYHRSGNVSYAFENSPEGIAYADKHGYGRIDLDLRVTKDGVVVATHTAKALGKDRIWAGFSDTAGKITDRGITIEKLTFAEVSRLKHKDGYRIYSVEYLIGVAKKTDISLYFELKTPITLKAHLPEIAAMLNAAQMPAIIGGQTTHAGQTSALAYARRLGFWTRNITAHTWAKPDKDSALCKQLEGAA